MKLAIALGAVLLIASSPSKRCGKYGELLYRCSKVGAVSDSLLQKGTYLLHKMSGRCLRQDVLIAKQDRVYNVGSPTFLYGRVCANAVSEKGVDAFMAYRMEHWKSGDEDFSFALERVFARRPDVVMERLSRFDETRKQQLLNEIVWGFVNNRLYGVENPYDDPAELLQSTLRDPMPEVLNQFTYRKVFFSLNPKMHTVAEEHPKDIDYILRQVQLYFDTWGSQD